MRRRNDLPKSTQRLLRPWVVLGALAAGGYLTLSGVGLVVVIPSVILTVASAEMVLRITAKANNGRRKEGLQEGDQKR